MNFTFTSSNLLGTIVLSILALGIFINLSKFIYRKIVENRQMKKMARSGIRVIDEMDGYQFEVYLKALFKELGYKPEVTKKTGDYGADLVLKGRNKIVIQAKRYNMKNKVSIGAIQEVYAAQAYYQANEAWVITNSLFTKQAEILAKACGVKLLDRYHLQEFINKINPEMKAQQIYDEVPPNTRVCVKCGNDMVVRKGKQEGKRFFGCSQFPSCRHTEPINK
ncbi:restriction endonuclease [Metabacillus fastidiosus]|uniref:restriction endonuclease n=1 Tax=Metabacillus fastidiosus TaxID=1458 RepID=UPI003D2D7F68